MNIAEIEAQLADLVKQPFDQREFSLRLLEIYNAPKATLTKLSVVLTERTNGPSSSQNDPSAKEWRHQPTLRRTASTE